ncbi:universal stress protein [Methanobacterium aggregans]|uniref:universal stress protein n=1 Tax=Methanobacterium aggregans TaxID=1615586 RepID=UPI001AE14143|nr:universal stress protein [Methanobacterium aggregans]MBP2045082.1 nucleotide-binding universal stress UspA family protein [Methanobacterium aggregans]
MFKNIMLPTDGSKFAEKAADIAIEMAKKLDARVTAVHVIDDKLIYPFEVLEEEGKTVLNHVQEKGKENGVPVDEILIVGSPTRDMEKIVEKAGADIIIIGTHGKTGLEKLLMGSVAENTLKTVKVPVLIVK